MLLSRLGLLQSHGTSSVFKATKPVGVDHFFGIGSSRARKKHAPGIHQSLCTGDVGRKGRYFPDKATSQVANESGRVSPELA